MSGLTRLKLVLSELKASAINPSISRLLNIAKATPSSLLSHPSIISFMMPSRILPVRPSAMNTTIRISANETIFKICSEQVIYCASQSPTILANLADAHTPKMIEMIPMTCDIKPFLMPWMMAGTRQIKIMISNIFINTLKCVYLRIEIFGKCSRLQK